MSARADKATVRGRIKRIQGGGTIVCGRSAYRSDLTFDSWFAFVNDNGDVLSETVINHGLGDEFIGSVLNNGDGTLAVISYGDNFLCLSEYDLFGNELSSHKTELKNKKVCCSARSDGGYLVQLTTLSYTVIDNVAIRDKKDSIIKIDRECNIIETFVIEGEDRDYLISDMLEYGGRIYLSTDAVPKNSAGGMAEALGYVFAGRGLELLDEEWTALFCNNHTAVLLVCDIDEGTPQTFYSVNGSMGASLDVSDNGLLKWNVESITSAFFSPATSSYTFGGYCTEFSYSFDASGWLVEEVETGATVVFRK